MGQSSWLIFYYGIEYFTKNTTFEILIIAAAYWRVYSADDYSVGNDLVYPKPISKSYDQ